MAGKIGDGGDVSVFVGFFAYSAIIKFTNWLKFWMPVVVSVFLIGLLI
ncbi:MAG: hypothetical protein KJ914_13745 [Gammaproteobacteria bacterium]|nr:hypothetical protein [Gammaproteobacteria bacterium]MBU1723828.1 hypothetical protein [Gammaproteobacteria bacterium]MBU2004474.1 hypothetical protein [Gammaproteobacteria bacterium]